MSEEPSKSPPSDYDQSSSISETTADTNCKEQQKTEKLPLPIYKDGGNILKLDESLKGSEEDFDDGLSELDSMFESDEETYRAPWV